MNYYVIMSWLSNDKAALMLYRFKHISLGILLLLIVVIVGSTTLSHVLASFTCNPASTLKRVSTSPGGTAGNLNSTEVALSGDGRYVVFTSEANNLVLGDLNDRIDVFLHDRLLCQTRLISTTHTGAQAPEMSFYPDISANGRYVTLYSHARLIPLAYGAELNRIDLQTNQIELVPGPHMPGNYAGEVSSISRDGRYVAFTSRWLLPVDNDLSMDLYLRDMQTYTTTFLSKDENPFFNWIWSPTISDDGTVAAFLEGRDYDELSLYLVDTPDGTPFRIATGLEIPENQIDHALSISANGRWLAWNGNLGRPGESPHRQVYVYDRQSATHIQVSLLPGNLQPGADASLPAISGNGRFVVFVVGRTLYRRDLQLGITEVLIQPSGSFPLYDGFSVQPVLSTDGSTVTFGVIEDVGFSNELSRVSQIYVSGAFGGMPSPTTMPTGFTPSPTQPAATRTLTPTPTLTPSLTGTYWASWTPNPYTATPTPTMTITPNGSWTPTITLTPSITPTPSITFTPSLTFTATLTPTATPTPTATNTPTCTANRVQLVFKGFGDFGMAQFAIVNTDTSPIILTDFTIQWRQREAGLRLEMVHYKQPRINPYYYLLWRSADTAQDYIPPLIWSQEQANRFVYPLEVPASTTDSCAYGCSFNNLWVTDTIWVDFGEIIGRLDTMGVTPEDFYGTTITYTCQGSLQTVMYGTPPPVTPTATQTDLSGAPLRNHYINGTLLLAWSSSANATRYEVQVDNSVLFNTPLDFQATVYAPETQRLVDPPLLPGVYYWRVRGCAGDSSCGNWSSSDSFVVGTG